LGGPRGRLISASDRETAVKLINEARAAGARLKPACEVLGISDRTYQRWTRSGIINEDQRPVINRPSPKNKLTEEERAKIIEVTNSPEFADLPSVGGWKIEDYEAAISLDPDLVISYEKCRPYPKQRRSLIPQEYP